MPWGWQNLLDKARGLVKGRGEQVDRGLDRAEDLISKRTGGEYDEKVSSAREKLDEAISDDSSDTSSEESTQHTGDDAPEGGPSKTP